MLLLLRSYTRWKVQADIGRTEEAADAGRCQASDRSDPEVLRHKMVLWYRESVRGACSFSQVEERFRGG